ncbi:hypothetical protein A6A06_16150 [Streptomyces sp. CB02923]|uniref:NUDIX hydrolase n=1 Tax=Streptomyces sp. CB02923 TaxID=1718985 RepID=UPI00093BD6A2|nr:NUDIX domain-containing protein [Streptomyces sp. CB02923]OKI02547.1 hypothetical protein A6A06_16150 [Streptomyces sp. CB02923]
MGEAARFICNAEVALRKGDRWLLIRRGAREAHAAGTLALVGGKVEVRDGDGGPVLESAVRREVAEEIGLHLTGPLHYVTSAHFALPDGGNVVNVVFCADFPGGEPVPQNPQEVAAVVWLSRRELEDSGAPKWTREYLALAEDVHDRLAH